MIRNRALTADDPENDEEQEAFAEGFVELRRVARSGCDVARLREDDGPRDLRRAAPQLAVNKVGDAPEKEADGRDEREAVGQV